MKLCDMKTPKTQNLEHGNPEIPKISKNWILKTQIRREVGEKKKMKYALTPGSRITSVTF